MWGVGWVGCEGVGWVGCEGVGCEGVGCYRPCHTSCCFVVICSSVWSFGSHFSLAGVKSLRVSPKCTSHIIKTIGFLGYLFIGTNRQKATKVNHADPLLHILPTFRSASRCEGRKCIVLGLCNASLLSSSSHLLLLFLLLFVPQYGRLAAILALLAFNHSACLRNARRISYQACDRGFSLHRNKQTNSRNSGWAC